MSSRGASRGLTCTAYGYNGAISQFYSSTLCHCEARLTLSQRGNPLESNLTTMALPRDCHVSNTKRCFLAMTNNYISQYNIGNSINVGEHCQIFTALGAYLLILFFQPLLQILGKGYGKNAFCKKGFSHKHSLIPTNNKQNKKYKNDRLQTIYCIANQC